MSEIRNRYSGKIMYSGEIPLRELILENKKDLRSANLRSANLISADLRSADLEYADLRDADLRSVDLEYANLRSANLISADLRSANLRSVELEYADLRDADLRSVELPKFQICPEEGSFIGYKKTNCNNILVLEILEDSPRTSSLIGRKCRAQKVKVLRAETIKGEIITDKTEFFNLHTTFSGFKYTVGEIAECREPFNNDIRIECASGIHFFITKKEAIEF
jgi:hypothetical protein